MSDITDWFNRLPIFTRWWLALTVVFSLLGRFGILQHYQLILLYEPLVKQFQIWRLATAVLYYPTGFRFLLNCYFLYNYSLRLETGVFDGRPADYLFMLLFNWINCVIISLIAGARLLMGPMVLGVLYVWCQLNKDVVVSFWFGTQFKAMYLPWVLFVFNIVLGGGIEEFMGILIGHLYFFLMFKYPQEFGGPSLISTPSILYSWFPNHRGGIHGFGQAPTPRHPADGSADAGRGMGRHNWGRGNVLGGN